jgi:hypothetical protein
MKYMIARLREASTWRAVIDALCAVGLLVDPSAGALILPTAMGVRAAIGGLLGDRIREVPPAS